MSLGFLPAARAYAETFSHVVGKSGMAELPQIKPLAQVPARLRAASALPPVQIGGCGSESGEGRPSDSRH